MFERTTVFRPSEGDYTTTRIPALVMTNNQVLLAFCEARQGGGGDWDPIDILLKRSSDSGRSWSPPMPIAQSRGEPVSNATPVVDRDGTVHLLFQRGYAKVYYRRSDDDGATWSPPRDITATFEAFHSDYNWRIVAPGPGHAIQLAGGRLVVALWLSTGDSTEFGSGKLGHRPSCVATVHSDDGGATWERGAIVVDTSDAVLNPSETVAVELSDGRVLLNIRSETPRHRRAISVSPDGAHDWSKPRFDDALYEPVCMASLLRIRAGNRQVLLFCNPDSRHNPEEVVPRHHFGSRENLALKLSYDDGATWSSAGVVDPGVAGYSDLAAGTDGTMYCLYEAGAQDGRMTRNMHIALVRFDWSWLRDNASGAVTHC